MGLKFLKKDRDALVAKIKELEAKVKQAGADAGSSAAETANAWHDNFGFEEATRQQSMWGGELARYQELLQKVELVEPETAPDTVGIGKTAVVMDMTESGSLAKFLIGSYMVLAPVENLPPEVTEVSYDSPIAKILMGAKGGATRRGMINNTHKVYFVCRVE